MYLYLCKSTIWPCKEYCCHVWAGTPNCYLDMLDRLQKQVCRTVCPSLAASLELLTQRQNVTSFSVFFGYYLVDVHLNLLNWFCFLFLVEGQWLYCMILMSIFTVSFNTQLDSGTLCLQIAFVSFSCNLSWWLNEPQ